MLDLVANAGARFDALSAIFDPNTTRCLLNRGVGPGWRCLEVAAGNGSVAAWLGSQVGPAGRVLATDIDARFLSRLRGPNIDTQIHDLTRDPIAESTFDLVHARMILIHLPERDEVLGRLTRALKPGGWLVCEEFDGVSTAPDPIASPGEVLLKTHQAMQRLSVDRNVDRGIGRRLANLFRALRLTHVGAEGRVSMAQAGSAIGRLLRASYELRRDAMIEAGYVTPDEFERDLIRMEDSDFLMPSPIMWTVWGQRACEDQCVPR